MQLRLKSNKFWFAALGMVLLISIAVNLLLRQPPAERARIYHNNVLVEVVDLTMVAEPFFITVESGLGTNVISIERGRIRMLSADCPDGTCVRQGWSNNNARPIVCLPHAIVIQFENASLPEVDAVVSILWGNF